MINLSSSFCPCYAAASGVINVVRAWSALSCPCLSASGLTLYNPVVTLRTARFNIDKLYVLATQCIYVFCVDLRTNSGYFRIQH